MQDNHNGVSRRKVLKATGGSIAAVGASGLAAAKPDKVEVNVGYSADSGRAAAFDAAVDVTRQFNFDAVTVTVPERAVDGLSGRPDVRYVEKNGEMHALAQTPSWGNDRVDAEVAHAAGYTGDDAHVAIIDTGIDSTHPDLKDNLGKGKAFVAGMGTPLWHDDNGHGTHCAGIADAIDNDIGVVGVSTEATLHAVKVLSAAGAGLTSDVAAGIEWTADQGYDVGSLSLGGGGDSDLLREACEYARQKGVLLVAAAGNSGPCTDCVSYPAKYDACMAISATDSNDNLASFSSTGPEVVLAAPGDSIYSTYLGGSYATLSGTSMACPHVSGAAAQLMAQGYSRGEARRRLCRTAEDIGLSSYEQGCGLLDVAAALGLDSSDN
jgi:subtilisin